MQFASVRLVTDDVESLAAFYQLITGVTPRGFEDFLELNIGGVTLAICSERSVAASHGPVASPRANRSVIVEFRVDDVDAERARLEGVVEDWVQEPTDQPWGNRSVLFRDPDGNLVNLFTLPPNSQQ